MLYAMLRYSINIKADKSEMLCVSVEGPFIKRKYNYTTLHY